MLASWSVRATETFDNFVLLEFFLAGGVIKLVCALAEGPVSFVCEVCVVCEAGEEVEDMVVETSCDESCLDVFFRFLTFGPSIQYNSLNDCWIRVRVYIQ